MVNCSHFGFSQKISLLFTSCKKIDNDLCYFTDDQDLEVQIAKLNGQIGQKDIEIRELQNWLRFGGGDYMTIYQDLQAANKEIKSLYK